MVPTLEIYKMPYATLIDQIQQCLNDLRQQAQKIEHRWVANKTLKVPRLSPSSGNPTKNAAAEHVMGLLQSSLPPEVLEESDDLIKDLTIPSGSVDDYWKSILQNISDELNQGKQDEARWLGPARPAGSANLFNKPGTSKMNQLDVVSA